MKTSSKLVNTLMIISSLVCIGCAIWYKEPIKFILSAIYMEAIRRWIHKPESEIGKVIHVETF